MEAAEAHTALATAFENRGDAAEAEAHYRRALGLRHALLGDDHAATAQAMNNLAVFLSDLGRDGAGDEAIALAQGALDTYRRLLGDDHLDVAQAYNTVGGAHYHQGDLDAAAPYFRCALKVRRRQLGDHPLVANTLSNLANILHDQGQTDEAVTLFREAIRIWRLTLPPDHPLVAIGLYGLGQALVDLERLDEAEAAFLESHAIDRATLPPTTRTSPRGSSTWASSARASSVRPRTRSARRRSVALPCAAFHSPNQGNASMPGAAAAAGRTASRPPATASASAGR